MDRRVSWTEPAWANLDAIATIRELFVFRRYRMLYRVTESRVYVLALIHGARDLLKALQE